MEYVAQIFILFIGGGISYWWHLHRKNRDRADTFKDVLVQSLASYESAEATLSATIVSLFPEHDKEFKKFVAHISKKKQSDFLELWKKYEKIYLSFARFGSFAPIMAELTHPDFGDSPEVLDLIEIKRKKEVIGVFNKLIEKL